MDFSALPSVETARLASTDVRNKLAIGDNNIDKVAKDFEAVFISQMLQPMFESLDTEGFFGGGEGEKAFRSMLVDEYGRGIANAGGIGIADKVKEQLIRLQEKKNV